MDAELANYHNKVFNPSQEFINESGVPGFQAYKDLYEKSKDTENFWGELAKENLVWDSPFQTVLEWDLPYSKWFKEGKLNASVQCLDKHRDTPVWNKKALIWEAEDGHQREFTYAELYKLTNKVAEGLRSRGVKKGDRVTIYMPLVPEVVATMLACARIGAAHSVVFAGFSSEALKDRILDSNSHVVVTADGNSRKGKVLPLKENVDFAVDKCPEVHTVLVLNRMGNSVNMKEGRDIWWKDLIENQKEESHPENYEAEQLLFTLYTSGTTGKPKGIMHTTAGYLLWAQMTTKWVFDLKPNDIYWCTADVGWVTGHTYLVYGPLQLGATLFMYEGAPNYPDWGRFWKMIEENKITVFYTAPTAIRAFMGQGDEIPEKYDLSSLRLMGTVGEPINPEAWMWYHKKIGHEKCPIVDTWWQTETGGIMISPLPGATPLKPGSCTFPLPGVFPEIYRKDGTKAENEEGGFLVLEKPWPGMLRGVLNDPDRYKQTYWSEYNDVYFAGDGARKDKDGYIWVIGRVDDVINVSGHRLGTAEIESALVSHPTVVEAAVVGRPDKIKGQGVVAFVTLEVHEFEKANFEKLGEELKKHVSKEIGAIAKPDEIRFTQSLPKTRSGKIMRRLLREIATSGETHGDTTTLEDSKVLESLMKQGDKEE